LSYPTGIAYDAANGYLYVANDSGRNLTVVDPVTDSIVQSIPIPSSLASVATNTLAIDSTNGDLYLADFGTAGQGGGNGTQVIVIDPVTDAVIKSTTVGLAPSSVAVDSENGNVYVSDVGNQTDPGRNVTVIDASSNSILTQVNVSVPLPHGGCPSPVGVAYDSWNGFVYVVGGADVCWINATTNTVAGSLSLGGSASPTHITFDSADGDLYVGGGGQCCSPANPPQLFVIDGGTNAVILNSTLPLTGPSTGVDVPGVGYDGRTQEVLVGVANYGGLSTQQPSFNTTIFVYNGTTLTGEFYAGLDSNAVSPSFAYDNQTGDVYSTNPFGEPDFGGTVSVGFIAAVMAEPPSIDANSTLEVVTRLPAGYVGAYSYRYSESNSTAGCVFGNSSQVPCTPSRQTSFTVTVNVTGTAGEWTVSTTPTIHVNSALRVAFTVSNSTPLLGQTVAFITNATGGVPPYNYSYSGFPPGCVSEDQPAIGCLPTQAGIYNVTVHIRDRSNVTVNATERLRVIFDFNVVVPAKTPAGSPFTISVNTNESFSGGTAVVPASGFGTLTYNYTGLPPGCASRDAPSITCTPTQVGTYHITVSVHDQVGDHNAHTVVVNVVPATSSAWGLASLVSGTTGYVLFGGIAAAVTIAAAVLLIRSRRRRKESRPLGGQPASSRPPNPPT
jgi:hypothetical protein